MRYLWAKERDIIYCNESYYNKLYYKDPLGIGTQLTNPITAFKPGIRACPKAYSRAVPSVEAHHHVHGPNIGRNSGGRGIKNNEQFGGQVFILYTNWLFYYNREPACKKRLWNA